MSKTTTPSKTPPPQAPSRTAFKTLSVWLPKEAAAAARAVSRHGRDIENATLHLLNSAFGSYYWDKAVQASRIKPEAARPPGSADALRAFASGIASLNAERTKSAALPAKAGEKPKKLTLVPEPQEATPAGEAETPGEDRPIPQQIVALLTAPQGVPARGGAKGASQSESRACQEKQGERDKNEFEGGQAGPGRPSGKGRSRHWLFRQGPWPDAANAGESSRRKVHADVNGAYNMIRKICPLFRWHEGLSLKHELWGLSKARGYRPLADMSFAKARG